MNNVNLNTLFDNFRKKIELTENQRQKIIGSHTYLRQEILNKLSYVKNTHLIGSYKKKTMIGPPDDVDMFAVLDYETYEIKPQSTLDKIKRDLQDTYPNSKIKNDKPCVVLDFSHCKFEVTPAIKYWNGYYIPKNNNEWESIEDPSVLEDKLSRKNEEMDKKLIPLLKIMKKMKRYKPNKYRTPSYKMEEMAIKNLYSFDSYRDGVQKLMKIYEWKDFWEMDSIKNLSDYDFYEKCRNDFFGYDFPRR